MSERRVTSIMCDTCGGWHPTEAHMQYNEGEEREKQMAGIKARPDSAYRFDTLGFKPEMEGKEKGEIEPWMHEVIEKAKDLGDDMQDTKWFSHFGPLGNSVKSPGILRMINNESLGEWRDARLPFQLYFVAHQAEDPVITWSHQNWINKFRNILVAQENYVQTRNPRDLQKYIKLIKDELQYLYSPSPYFTVAPERPLESFDLTTTDGRRDALDFLEKYKYWKGLYLQEKDKDGKKLFQGVDIIFKISKGMMRDPNFRVKQTGDAFSVHRRDNGTEVFHTDGGPPLEGAIVLGKETLRQMMIFNRAIYPEKEPIFMKRFYRQFIHGIRVSYGSIETQQEVLELMLKMTKDHPERRLPIYNFYGKLVWPRPPEEKKK